MSNIYFFVLLALIAGAMLPTQAAANNKMSVVVDSPILAALISFLVGTIGLLFYGLVTGSSLANITSAKNAGLIAWIGGLLGAFFVASTILLLPRIGVAMTFGLVVAGQMLMTLVIDHFGLLDVAVRQISWGRTLGILLIVGGVILIRRF